MHRDATHGRLWVEQTTPGTLHWRTPAGQEFWTNAHGTWKHPPPDLLTNDPDNTTTEVLTRVLQIIAARKAPPAPPPLVATQAEANPEQASVRNDPPPF